MEIMIFEDSYAHKKDAVKTVEAAGHQAFSLITSPNLSSAIYFIRKRQKEGKKFWVMTDLFFIIEHTEFLLPEERGERYASFPSGLLVMAECQKLGIPCVIVTAGYHHSSACEPVTKALRALGWPDMVDSVDSSSSREELAQTKNWSEGIRHLERMTMDGAG